MTDMELADEIERRRDSEAREYAQLALSYSQWQQIIAALRRWPERPPSGEMVMVPREPTEDMIQAIGDSVLKSFNTVTREEIIDAWHKALSAAEAEGRKS